MGLGLRGHFEVPTPTLATTTTCGARRVKGRLGLHSRPGPARNGKQQRVVDTNEPGTGLSTSTQRMPLEAELAAAQAALEALGSAALAQIEAGGGEGSAEPLAAAAERAAAAEAKAAELEAKCAALEATVAALEAAAAAAAESESPPPTEGGVPLAEGAPSGGDDTTAALELKARLAAAESESPPPAEEGVPPAEIAPSGDGDDAPGGGDDTTAALAELRLAHDTAVAALETENEALKARLAEADAKLAELAGAAHELAGIKADAAAGGVKDFLEVAQLTLPVADLLTVGWVPHHSDPSTGSMDAGLNELIQPSTQCRIAVPNGSQQVSARYLCTAACMGTDRPGGGSVYSAKLEAGEKVIVSQMVTVCSTAGAPTITGFHVEKVTSGKNKRPIGAFVSTPTIRWLLVISR